jgi:hypothetical protein
VCTPWGALDAGCTSAVFTDDCAPGLFCNAANHCQAPGGVGAACSGSLQCDTDHSLYCATGNTCAMASRCQLQ